MKAINKVLIGSLLSGSITMANAEVEAWYAFWSVGMSSHTYPTEVQDVMNEKPPEVSRTQVALDMFGFYWPVASNKSILGVVINGTGDSLTDGYNTVSFNQTTMSLSAMHFFGSEPGDGFFIRGDVGTSTLSISQDSYTIAESESGLGLLGGAGYGIKVSEDSRVLLGVSFSRNYIPNETDEEFDSLQFTIGGLW